MKKLGGVTLGFTLLLLGVPAYASLLTVCGSTELPGQNFVAFVCGAGANMMSGTATETIVDNTLDDIHISPAVVTGTSLLACGGSCIGGNTHPNFFGSGVLIATFIGVLDNPGLAPPAFSIGGEVYDEVAHANNFTGNNAFVFWTGAAGAPLPEPVPNPAPGFNAQNGFYNNSTMLSFSLHCGGSRTRVSLVLRCRYPGTTLLLLASACSAG